MIVSASQDGGLYRGHCREVGLEVRLTTRIPLEKHYPLAFDEHTFIPFLNAQQVERQEQKHKWRPGWC